VRLVSGDVGVARIPRLLGISILTGKEVAISEDDFELLSRLPSDRWTELEALEPAARNRMAKLAQDGLVVSSEDDPLLNELRQRDHDLAAAPWNIYGALFHALTSWRDVDLRRDFGDPPEAACIRSRRMSSSGTSTESLLASTTIARRTTRSSRWSCSVLRRSRS
jgi:hypothetical protein